MERKNSITDCAIVIFSGFHVYVNYYDSWEDALQSYVRLTGHLEGNDFTLVRLVVLTFKDEIKAFYNIK